MDGPCFGFVHRVGAISISPSPDHAPQPRLLPVWGAGWGTAPESSLGRCATVIGRPDELLKDIRTAPLVAMHISLHPERVDLNVSILQTVKILKTLTVQDDRSQL